MISLTYTEFRAKEDNYYLREYEKDCRIRKLAFVMAAPYLKDSNAMTIYEFWPLALDPSPEQLQEMKDRLAREEYNNAIKWRQQFGLQLETQIK